MTPLPEQVRNALARGAEVITATQHTARTLRRAFDKHMQTSGAALWEPAPVLALDTWLATQWQQLILDGETSRLPLSRLQELRVWQGIVRDDAHPAAGLADFASHAWSQLLLYSGRSQLQPAASSTDAQAFLRWANEFDRRCQAGDWLSTSQLAPELARAARRGRLRPPAGGLLLIGFDDVPPATEALFAALTQAGWPIETEEALTSATEAVSVACADQTAELTLAAGWAAQQLRHRPQMRIGIVVTNLTDRRPVIERAFRELLPPGKQSRGDSFEFSQGTRLASTPLAAAALDLLRWTTEPLPFETVSSLLLSPCFGASLGPAAQYAAAEFDAFELRRRATLRPELSLEQAITRLEASPRRQSLSDVLARLRAMRLAAQAAQLGQQPPRTHGEWADAFRAVLDAARWNRRTQYTSQTHQAADRWESALDELATLDFDASRVDASTCLAELQIIAVSSLLAPEPAEAPVQILGSLEAAGFRFDALWVLGASDADWPSRLRPNPLLPWKLQRALGMPEANRDRAQSQAARLATRLVASAPTIFFSFPHASEAGAHQLSRALSHLSLRPMAPHELLAPEPVLLPPRLQRVSDDLTVPRITDGIAAGGASILQDQAACPFRSFAAHRLRSTPLETARLGLDVRQRGSDLHRVLDAFWREIGDQTEFKALTAERKYSLVEQAVTESLQNHSRQREIPWDNAYLQVQHERLRGLVLYWLERERDRPAFLVKERETVHEAVIGPLRLSLKFDRVDTTKAGDLILDYKTGEAATAEWLGDRPDSPQLPLYAVLSDPQTLAGVAFAQVRAGDKRGLTGFVTSDTVLDGQTKQPDFATQLEDWRRVITNLATSFTLGDAAVDPKLYPQTCMFCSQRLLCRLNPNAVTETELVEEDNFV